ncbi:hypothetical protein Tco_0339009 [Tanacetum coccineum]
MENKKETQIDWEELRKSYCGIREKEVNENYKDEVDWDAVRRCPVKELSKIIIDRGMQNKLAKRIKIEYIKNMEVSILSVVEHSLTTIASSNSHLTASQ